MNMRYMERALALARLGEIGAHPNPMVGAVIVTPSGLIAGEGYHKRCGQAHAEVNAVNHALRNGANLAECTIYVTLEPCAHYGKTPPCAELLIRHRLRRVVVGCIDPFAQVQGRGIAMLRQAGIDVEMAPEEMAARCRALNVRFFTAHSLRRPFVALKWAETLDGFVDRLRSPQEPPLAISPPLGRMAVHRYRSTFDAITVGSNTEQMDRPRLDARLWPGGRTPERVYITSSQPLSEQLHTLYARGITSLLVEGGPTLQRAFLQAGMVDEIRREVGTSLLHRGHPSL